jgi:arylsulfatase
MRMREASVAVLLIVGTLGNLGQTAEPEDRRPHILFLMADHGDMLGDHHLWRKTYAYEPSARIPMLIRWPSRFVQAPRGQVITHPVELRDILPTFLDAARVAYDPAWFDGRSMLDLIRGRDEGWRKWIDLEHATCYDPSNYWSALTDGRTKYIYYATDGRQQLFDLTEDPGETRDLSALAEYAPELQKWRDRLVAHLAERGEPFVVQGDLSLRPKTILHSPNYPDPPPARKAKPASRR